jgi:rhodanese-related sulfurtransferase
MSAGKDPVMFSRRLCLPVLVQAALGLSLTGLGPIFTPVQAEEQQRPEFGVLQSTELDAMLQKKDFFFVNVHIPYQGEIRDTDAFIPYDKIAASLDKLPKDKNAPIVLYCLGGGMSEIAAQELAQLGYTHVSHLSGGMFDWRKRGYPIINDR